MLAPSLPSELSLLLAAQAATGRGAAADDDEQTARAAALATLAGPSRYAHAYDAALGWERRGRPDEAARVFAHVVAAEDADAALRMRARFHLGRLFYERGDHASAGRQFTEVIRATPDHRRAQGYLEAIEKAAKGTG
jgi:TolA-binding protein